MAQGSVAQDEQHVLRQFCCELVACFTTMYVWHTFIVRRLLLLSLSLLSVLAPFALPAGRTDTLLWD
eukprot:708698-Amphidinium_carterae.1